MAVFQEAQPLKVATISESEMGDNGAFKTIHYLWTQVFSLAAHWDLVLVQSCTRCKPEGSAGSGLMAIA